jgi:hypothetical protein
MSKASIRGKRERERERERETNRQTGRQEDRETERQRERERERERLWVGIAPERQRDALASFAADDARPRRQASAWRPCCTLASGVSVAGRVTETTTATIG